MTKELALQSAGGIQVMILEQVATRPAMAAFACWMT